MQFDAKVYSLNALQSAAYRCIDDMSCIITSGENFHICSIIAKNHNFDLQLLNTRFTDVANDEALRERLKVHSEPIRNLLLSLAFGALAHKQ